MKIDWRIWNICKNPVLTKNSLIEMGDKIPQKKKKLNNYLSCISVCAAPFKQTLTETLLLISHLAASLLHSSVRMCMRKVDSCQAAAVTLFIKE